MRNIRRKSAVAVILACAALIVVVTLVALTVTTSIIGTRFTCVFYNDTSPLDRPNYNSGDVLDGTFISSILVAAPEAVRLNPEANVEWFVNDLINRIYNERTNSGDPALLAQLAVDAGLRAPKTVGEKLLPNAKQNPDLWPEITLELVDNPKKHIGIAGKLFAAWNKAVSVSVRPITEGYTSMGYQRKDGIILDAARAEKLGRKAIPMPILSESDGRLGYELVFTFANGEELAYRINCGYQPDVTRWQKPPTPSNPTDPPSIPTPPPTVEPTPGPTKDSSRHPGDQGNAPVGAGDGGPTTAEEYKPDPPEPPEEYVPPVVVGDGENPVQGEQPSGGGTQHNADPPPADPLPNPDNNGDMGLGDGYLAEPG